MNLQEAAKVGDLQWILDNPPSIEEIHEEDNAALAIAATHGHLDIVQYLHQHGAEITMNDSKTLCWSTENGHLDVIKYLHENGADITADDNLSIQWAAHFGRLEIVRYLHENGADLLADDEYTVRWASRNGHLDIVKYCIENGADITADDNFAVKWSSTKGHFEVVKFLLDNGADPFAIGATTKKLRTLVAENFLERLDLSALSDTPITKKFLNTFGKQLRDSSSHIRKSIEVGLFDTMSFSQVESIVGCPMTQGRTLETSEVNTTSRRI